MAARPEGPQQQHQIGGVPEEVQSPTPASDQEFTITIPAGQPGAGNIQVLIELNEPPATRVFASVMAASKLQPAEAVRPASAAAKAHIIWEHRYLHVYGFNLHPGSAG